MTKSTCFPMLYNSSEAPSTDLHNFVAVRATLCAVVNSAIGDDAAPTTSIVEKADRFVQRGNSLAFRLLISK